MTRLPRRASLFVTFSLLTSTAMAGAEGAWVLWEHFTGVMHGNAEDFWVLRDSDESRAGCLQRAEQEVELQTGGQPESLRGKMAQVDLRLGWSRQVKTPTSYVERGPEGQRDFASLRRAT
jgi:hypothetical protein